MWNAIASWTIPWAAHVKKHCQFKRAMSMCRWAAPPHEPNANVPICPVSNMARYNGSPCECPGQAPENQDAIALRSQVKYYCS